MRASPPACCATISKSQNLSLFASMEARVMRMKKYSIVFSHQTSIFTQNPSSSTTPKQPLFAPSRSIKKFDPSLLSNPTSRNPDFISSCSSLHSSSFRFFSTSMEKPHGLDPNQLKLIVDIISANASDMETKLAQTCLEFSQTAVVEVIHALNYHGLSALRFFNWLLNAKPWFRPTPEIYNHVVNNLGLWNNYTTMLPVLNKLSSIRHCLTEKAFAFLTARDPTDRKESVRRISKALNQVGGSCRGSGIHSLIKLLCGISCFDDAIFLMGETARKTSYYNVLIAAKCRNGDFQGARDVFGEMRKFGCDPTIQSYNYLLGSLFKNKRVVEGCDLMQMMEELGYLPDPVTLEVVACSACKEYKMDFAIEFLKRMLGEGIKPRLTMHAAFVKGYFWAGRAGDAYKYVVDMSEKDKCSANTSYSLLVSLLRKSGRVMEARNLLHEMIEKGLRPNYPVYIRVMKDLHKIKRGDLSSELKTMFSEFNPSAESADPR